MITYTVPEINRILKDLIDNELVLEDILVTGELSSFSITRNIAYFTLKDNDNLLSCVQFNCHQEFNVGDMVSVRGNIKYYPKGGKLTFNALKIELCGQGELYQQFLKLKDISEYTDEKAHINEEKALKTPSYLQEILPVFLLFLLNGNTFTLIVKPCAIISFKRICVSTIKL